MDLSATESRLHYGLVIGEILHILRVMRQNRRWRSISTAPYVEEPWLTQSFQSLRWSLESTVGVSADFDRMQLIRPFVAAIRSEETNGPITGAALSSLFKFISANMFSVDVAFAAAAISEIADASSHCRFEATDAGNDELVLMKILQIHLACLSAEGGAFLSDSTVWEMIQTCFRIYRQMRPPDFSQLLCDRAKHSLFEMIRIIFRSNDSPPFSGEKLSPSTFDGVAVHDTNLSHLCQRFGIPCRVKVLGSLISMGRASVQPSSAFAQRQQVILVLQLILAALEFGGDRLVNDKSLLGLVQDDICSFLLQHARSTKTAIIAHIMRIFYCIVVNLRDHAKVQIEVILNTIFLGCEDGPFEVQEIILESLLDFARFPWFFRELFFNYDCCLRSSNLFENLVTFLCQMAHPSSSIVNGNNILAIRCLTMVINHFFASVDGGDQNQLAPQLSETKKQKIALFECISKFNIKPKLGFEALVETGFMESNGDSQSAANILWHTPGVDKVVLGEFFGTPSPFAAEVLSNFIAYSDFRGKNVVDALRICLEGFRLPVEAQQIDRIVQEFSNHYYSHNPDDFANPDVVHILTFALIMLNTDAHNDGIKNKMTLEQFMRNVRGINHGESFSYDFLEDLYQSIVSEELKISKSGPGGDMSKSLWTEMIVKAHTEFGKQYTRFCCSRLDVEMFALVWKPIVETVSVLFEVAEPGRALEVCSNMFELTGSFACLHHMPSTVDMIVSFCCHATRVLVVPLDVDQILLSVGTSHSRAQTCFRVIFKRNFYEHMQASWQIWLNLVFQLLHLSLLPPSLTILDDFVHGVNEGGRRRLSFPNYIQKPVSLQSIFSSVQYFLMASHDNEEATLAIDKLELARDSGQAFLQQLQIDEFLADTSYLSSQSLICLIKALTTLVTLKGPSHPNESSNTISDTHSGRRSSSYSSDPALIVKHALFYLQLLTSITIRNRDRLHLFWDHVHPFFSSLINTQLRTSEMVSSDEGQELLLPFPVSNSMAEAACVAIMQLCSKLLPMDSEETPILGLLGSFLKFDVFNHQYSNIGQQIVFGLLHMLQSNSQTINSHEGWNIVFELLIRSAAHEHTVSTGFEIFALICSDKYSTGISSGSMQAAIQVNLRFAQSKAGAVSERLRSIDYFALLHGRLSSLDCDPLEATRGLQTSDAFKEVSFEEGSRSNSRFTSPRRNSRPISVEQWRFQILDALRIIICSSERFSLREHALVVFQQILLSPECKALSAFFWKDVFNKVLTVMLKSLSSSKASSHYLSKCRCAVVSLICRLFLTYLKVLLDLGPSEFQLVWCTLLKELVDFVDLETDYSQSQSLLSETVIESLKNMFRVISASEVGDLYTEDLWRATWDIIDPALPELRQETFPEEAVVHSEDETLSLEQAAMKEYSIEQGPETS